MNVAVSRAIRNTGGKKQVDPASTLASLHQIHDTEKGIIPSTVEDEEIETRKRSNWLVLAFMFSHVGLCGLVVGYAMLGAVIFQAIEYPFEYENAWVIRNATKKLVKDLLEYTKDQVVLVEATWKREADIMLKAYEEKMVQAVNFAGYDGDDETVKYQWTYFGALLYSITVFTTIGYGHICPKTALGRGVTILYAMIGIPLMLLCLANIAETLAQLFTFIYFKICCAYCRWKKTRRRIKRAALSFRFAGTTSFRRGQSVRTRNQPPGLRRHASLRSYSSGPPKKTFSDTRSVKSFRVGGARDYRSERADQQKWDSYSLPGGRSRGRDAESRSVPPPMRRGQSLRSMVVDAPASTSGAGFLAAASARLRNFIDRHSPMDMLKRPVPEMKMDDDNNKTIPLALDPHKKHRRCQIRCSACCRSGNDGPPSPVSENAVFYSSAATTRYVNSSSAASGAKIVMEMKTLPSGAVKNQRHRRASESAAAAAATEAGSMLSSARFGSTSANEEQEEKAADEPRLPQIVISDNEIDDTMGQIASDEDEGDDVVYLEDDTAKPTPGTLAATITAPTPAPTSAIVHRSATLQEERSTLSKRSDEASLRSAAKKAGGNYKQEKMPVVVGVLTVVIFVLAGAVLFSTWENWSFFEGAYFSFITLTTIGFGDMVPGKSLDSDSQEKLIICSLYLLFGMALIAMCFKLMQDDVVQKTRWLGQKIGILVKTESSDEESEYEEEMDMEEQEEELSEDRTEDKRTVSSGSSKRDEEEARQPTVSEKRNLKR